MMAACALVPRDSLCSFGAIFETFHLKYCLIEKIEKTGLSLVNFSEQE